MTEPIPSGHPGRRSRAAAAVLAVTAGLLLTAAPAGAHQPRLVRDRPSIIVENPEISQAFYAWLDGGPQTYYIRSGEPFVLYLNLLVPDQPGIDTDYEAVVYREWDSAAVLSIGFSLSAGREPLVPCGSRCPAESASYSQDFTSISAPGEVIARLDGRTHEWTAFYEPFGGDHYLMGPEFEERVPAGRYRVVVSSPDNQGRYALAVGKKESFPPGEIIRTIGVLPKLKKEFFGKSPLTAYFNLSGAFLLVVVGGAIGLGALFF